VLRELAVRGLIGTANRLPTACGYR